MLFECRYSCFPPLKNFNKIWNHLILVTNKRIKRKVRCWMTKRSTFSWGSVCIVANRLFCEDKTLSNELTMSDPDSLVPKICGRMSKIFFRNIIIQFILGELIIITMFNRPGVAGATLQSFVSLIHSLSQWVSDPFLPNLQNIFKPKLLELGSLNFERFFF